jgi:UDP-GlcNAc:undecaprenyl-phosphate GlcNAc-1-phosphate transferase
VNWPAVMTALGVSLLVTLTAMRPALRLAERYDLLDKPGRHKRHDRAVPNVGGIILFVSMWTAVLICLILFYPFFAELAHSLLYVFCGAMIIFLVGLADDLSPLSAWTKLLAQVAAGLVLYLGGLAINPVSIPFMGSHDIGSFSVVITVVWIVLLTNAINLIDGLDGLAGGVSLIACLTLALIGGLYSVGPAVLFAYALIGFLAIFLFYNRYPAKVFLGDSGSLQIGYYFAVVSLLVPIKSFTAAALYIPLLALGVPLLETGTSIFRRLARGKALMKADRRHLFHYLAAAGLSPRAIVGIFYLLSALFGGFALAMYFFNRLLVFGLLILFMVVIVGLFYIFMAKLGRPTRDRSNHEESRQ